MGKDNWLRHPGGARGVNNGSHLFGLTLRIIASDDGGCILAVVVRMGRQSLQVKGSRFLNLGQRCMEIFRGEYSATVGQVAKLQDGRATQPGGKKEHGVAQPA